ncbi:hypothetical protein BMS_1464 [Halobacteriovorax marinus SJ]|uniref:Uncharacterized protein n=1 Tax=Halobacteriovorax marinus (strain ATCC BAA-682 / DSM 15412 / SJ) TaxID=862908 RepID=E1X096_HALMS|nr:hypothetical protein [Halobacteriovorax marinus]CBW26324.1 hypothetical protein BMS_1464 [Halobacteriovorax marinus SJ]
MSENQAKPKSNRNRRYRGRPKKKNPNAQQASNKPSNNNNRKKRYNNRRGPKLSLEDQITLKYNNLLEQHLVARKKYFALYHRADPKQKAKLERIYYNTIAKLREFERGLSGDKLDIFQKHFNSLKEDHIYSVNHEIEPIAEHVSHQGDFDDPHFLQLQKEAKTQYSEDTEESVGSIDDYKQYKGL